MQNNVLQLHHLKYKSKCYLISGDTLSEEEVMLLVNAADKDGDGTLDFEEFVKIMLDK